MRCKHFWGRDHKVVEVDSLNAIYNPFIKRIWLAEIGSTNQ